MIRNATLMAIAIIALVLSACAAPQAPAPAVTPPAQATAAPQQQGWQADWERTLAAARREGNLSIVTGLGSEQRVEIDKRFKEKFGLEIDWVPVPAAQISPKLFRERQAGLYLVDYVMGALSRQLGELKPAGALDPLKPLLILPEVVDKSLWFGGDINWCDNDGYIVNNMVAPEILVRVNTSMVKPGEIKSYNDLLDPRWKEKIVLIHPVNNTRVVAVMHSVMGLGYLQKLAAQRPVITDDQRLVMDTVARGKYPVGISTRTDIFVEYARAGAPVARVKMQEGTTVAAAQNSLSLINRAPHPNAAKIFANWFLSKEFGTFLSRLLNTQSARLDVPTDPVNPEEVLDPSGKYIFAEKEDFQNMQLEVKELAKGIFAQLLK